MGIKAILAAANISDLLKGIIVAPAKLVRGRAMMKKGLEAGDGMVVGKGMDGGVPRYERAPGT